MEQETGPDVKKFFQRIINTLFAGLLWLMAVATAGIYFKLGWQSDGQSIFYVILFYAAAIISFAFLLRYYYKIWKD